MSGDGTTVHEEIFGTLRPDLASAPALSDDAGRAVAYGELRELIDAMARRLLRWGLRPGDTVGLHCPNGVFFAVAFYGILRAGCVVTPINALATAPEVASQLSAARARAVVREPSVSMSPPGCRALSLDERLWEDLRSAPVGVRTLPHVPDTALAALPFSSGTSGSPKGVELTHRNLVANLKQYAETARANGMRPGWRVLSPLPLSHIYGMNVVLGASLLLRTHLMTMARFSLPNYLAALRSFGAHWGYVAPPILSALARDPGVSGRSFPQLQVLLSGAAPLDSALITTVERRIGARVTQGFGLTEASPVTHVAILPAPGREPFCAPGWVGSPVAGTQQRVVAQDGAVIPLPERSGKESAPGELWVKGPQVMRGYRNDPEATRRAIDPEGWLRTGNLVVADYRGCIRVVDRLKEVLNYKGFQVSPAELEAVVRTHPQVADAAVMGRTRSRDGEQEPVAFLVPQRGAAVSTAEVLEWAAARVAPYKRIRAARVVDAIPRNAAGKIVRRELRW